MKLSEDPDYLAWGRSFADRDYTKALAHIDAVLERARQRGDRANVGYLLGVIAKTCVEMGDLQAAARKFEEQDAATDGDPVGRFFVARFWSELHGRPDLALGWLKRIIDKREAEIAKGLPLDHKHDKLVQSAREMMAELETRIAPRG